MNLERWSREGIAPPRAAPLQIADPTQARATLALDPYGNAKGGLRTPYVDVPLFRYGVYMDGPGICELWGYQVPLDARVLSDLYSTTAIYREKIATATRRAVAGRWLTPEDAARVLDEAARQNLNLP